MSVPAKIRKDPIAWADEAKRMVLACDDVGQVKEMAAQAKAALAYFREKLGKHEAETRAVAEVEILTLRRIGELIPKGSAGRGKKNEPVRAIFGGEPKGRAKAAKARALAEVPWNQFEGYLEDRRKAERSPTAGGALRRGGKIKPSPRSPLADKVHRENKKAATVVDMLHGAERDLQSAVDRIETAASLSKRDTLFPEFRDDLERVRADVEELFTKLKTLIEAGATSRASEL